MLYHRASNRGDVLRRADRARAAGLSKRGVILAENGGTIEGCNYRAAWRRGFFGYCRSIRVLRDGAGGDGRTGRRRSAKPCKDVRDADPVPITHPELPPLYEKWNITAGTEGRSRSEARVPHLYVMEKVVSVFSSRSLTGFFG